MGTMMRKLIQFPTNIETESPRGDCRNQNVQCLDVAYDVPVGAFFGAAGGLELLIFDVHMSEEEGEGKCSQRASSTSLREALARAG
jgi:hypothetical protein